MIFSACKSSFIKRSILELNHPRWNNWAPSKPTYLSVNYGTSFVSTKVGCLLVNGTHHAPRHQTPQQRGTRKKAQHPCSRNQVGARPSPEEHKRPVSKVKETDFIMCYQPDTCCTQCGGNIVLNTESTHRNEVFQLPKASLDLTEYQLFHGRCQYCNHTVRANLPDDAPSSQLDPRLLSHIAVLSS